MDSIFIYSVVFIIGTLFISEGTRYTKLFNSLSIVGLFILIMFAAGRYHVGTDTTTYIHTFERFSTYSWSYFFENMGEEWLFALIAKITYTIGGRVLTWGVFAAMTIIPVYITLRKQYPEVALGVSFLTFLFLYYTTSFNVARQFIAVALIFWGIKYIFQNRFIPFLLVVVVATGFHLSAFIALFAWFLWNHKENCAVNGWRRIILITGMAIVTLGYQMVIEFVTSHINAFSTYAGYAETSSRGQNRDLYVSILELIILLFFSKRLDQMDKRNGFMLNLFILSVLIGFTGFTHPQVKRIAFYFSVPSLLVSFGYLPFCFTENSRILAKTLICVFTMAVFILTAYVLGQSNLIPYQFDLFSAW